MSKLVADSCVVIKWLVDEPGSEAAGHFLALYEADRLELLAPDFIYAELGNILWKKIRRQTSTTEEAGRALAVLRQIQFHLVASADLIDEAMQIGVAHDQSPYDCLYVALSQRAGCPLVTADEKLVRKVAGVYPQVVLLADQG